MLEKRNKRWGELPAAGRRTILALGVVQVALHIAALWDLRRRPAAEVRGRKGWWAAATFVNFVGPLAYFVAGRRRAASRHWPVRRRSLA